MKINPIYKQETRISARSFRFPLIILLFNSVLAGVALLNMYSMVTQVRRTAEIQYSSFLSLYVFVAVVEFVLLLFIIPAITAGSISGERERQTLNLMLTTHMTAADVVLGKLFAGLVNIFLMIVSSFPILALAFIYGGVSEEDIVRLLICYGMTALLMGCLGIFCSASFKKSTTATVASYCMAAGLLAGTVGINQLASLFWRATSVNGAVSSGGCIYLLLFNPASTFLVSIGGQMNSGSELSGVFPWMDTVPMNMITEHWMVCSVVMQGVLALLLLALAVRQVEPCRRKKKKG